MAYTAPGTAVAGDVLTASFWNQQVRDNMEAVAGAPFARNILYNGAMQVAQRGTSTAGVTASGWPVDRWNLIASSLGTWTVSQETDAPTGSGFRNSMKLLVTTADAAPAASDYAIIRQGIEGYNAQTILKGTSSALQLTLSFWVKSNVTGTHVAYLNDNTNGRVVSAAYTISASGTWEKKSVTFPADTTGTLPNDNSGALYAAFGLGAGSNYTGGTLATSWTTTQTSLLTGQQNVASAINNYIQITGVQLEVGSAATGFEFLPFGDELARCQRYFYVIASGGADRMIGSGGYFSSAQFECAIHFPVAMRTAPVGSFTTGTNYYLIRTNGGAVNVNYVDIYGATFQTCLIFTAASGTSGAYGRLTCNAAGAFVGLTAEL